MPVSLADSTIRTAYSKLGRKVGSKSASLDDLKGLLAVVADRAGMKLSTAQEQIKKATSTQELMSIVKEGMSDGEKADLTSILDAGDVKLGADAKQFLTQLVGRAPVNQPHGSGPVSITGMKLVDGKVKIEGSAAPNVTVEALNLSLIPQDRLGDDDTFVLGKTDASGALVGSTDLRGGDWLRIRTRDADGKTSDWMVVRADQLGADKDNATLAFKRIDLTDAGGGKVALANNNNARPLSEPFAKVQFTNTRTNDKTVIALDDTGRFPGVPKLDGKPGDSFDVAVSDGRNNADFKKLAATLAVQGGTTGATGEYVKIEDPLPHKDDRKPDGTSRYDLKNYTGPLFLSGTVDYQRVTQGNLGDCDVPGAAAALSFVRPDSIPQFIRVATEADRKLVNADRAAERPPLPPLPAGKFYVVEFQIDRKGKKGKHLEAVDADFYTRSSGGPIYGTSSNSTAPDKMELWFPLFEKAWAQLNGGYQTIGEGGASSDIFAAVLGRPALEQDLTPANKDAIFRTIKDKLSKKLPVCLGTKDDKGHAALFANTGIYGDHTYTVLDAYEKNGVKYLKLRNPWGESEPAGNGPNDGIFDIKLDEVPKFYSVLWSVK